MKRTRLCHLVSLAAVSFSLAAFALLLTAAVVERNSIAAAGLTLARPVDEPSRGLVFAGLTATSGSECRGGYLLPESGLCTHGPDAAPEGVDVPTQDAPAPASAQVVPEIACEGDGVSGNRTQLIYARPSGNAKGDRYNAYLATFRQIAAGVDTIYDASAAETGGSRRIRFVTEPDCTPSVLNVVLSPTGADTFDRTISELQAQGYNRGDRKYLVFMDANVLCGIGTFYSDDRPGSENYSNGGIAGYARVDVPCWEVNAAAHEHMHTLGGVQNSAPNASGGSHCVDEYDVMCYSDTPNRPTLRYLCPDAAANDRFDCGKDDYFNTAPVAGSYLATHWNTANNQFLIKSASPNPIYTAPSAPPTPSTNPVPSPAPPTTSAAATARLVVQESLGGIISPGASAVYNAGTVVTARATPHSGYLFVGWRVDGADRGWANPLALTMDTGHTLAAIFVARPAFADLAADDPAYEAIGQLAARGIIRGYDATTFGPGDQVLRAQMAALLARAMRWDTEEHGNPFPDRQGVDDALWRNVGTLAHHGVAKGYSDGRGGTYYDPTGEVLHAQTISFITRAMIARGYWQAQPASPALYGGILNDTGHEADVATFIHYTRAFGGVPGYPEGGNFAAWDQPATRAWFAQALWVALDSAQGGR
jgi:hypothetical protein